MRMKPHLIQRLRERRLGDQKKGVDSRFEMDYMGSAEFEFGTLPKTLAAMRSLKSEIEMVKLTAHGHDIFYVGPAKSKDLAMELVQDQLSSGRHVYHLKESTYMDDSFGLDKNKYHADIIGWWTVCDSGDLSKNWEPFALFKHEHNARQWKKLAYE